MIAFAILGPVPELAAPAAGQRPDAELIREAQNGSHRAFEELVRRYSERAYRAAFRVVRDAQIAEDVLQEALLKAYRSLRSFESRSSFYTWLYRITVNLALDRQRRALDSLANPHNGAKLGRRRRKIMDDPAGALEKQAHRAGTRRRRVVAGRKVQPLEIHHRFGLQPEPFARCRQDFDAGRRGQDLGDQRRFC